MYFSSTLNAIFEPVFQDWFKVHVLVLVKVFYDFNTWSFLIFSFSEPDRILNFSQYDFSYFQVYWRRVCARERYEIVSLQDDPSLVEIKWKYNKKPL